MNAQEVSDAMAAGAVLIDMRPPQPHAAEHVAGAINFQFNRADLADRAEMALPKGQAFIVHAEPEPIAKVAVQILAEAGYDVRGYLQGGLKAWQAAGLPTAMLPLLDVDEVRERAAEFRVVDTRERFEFRYGHVPGAELLEWTHAWDRAASVPGDKPIALICGDQVRSAYVASVLQRLGRPALLVFGGMADWQERGYPVEKGT
jgi:rhodanese-related sulfurtransferase